MPCGNISLVSNQPEDEDDNESTYVTMHPIVPEEPEYVQFDPLYNDDLFQDLLRLTLRCIDNLIEINTD